MAPNKSIDVSTETTTRTDTHIALLLTVGMIAAFTVGMALIVTTTSVDDLLPPKPILVITPLKITDLMSATVQADPATSHSTDVYSSISFSGYPSSTNFGSYGLTGQSYTDGTTTTTNTQLAVSIPSPTHPAMIASVQANGTRYAICIPEKATATISRAEESDGPKWLPTAHAQVNINTGTNTNNGTCIDGTLNGCYRCANNAWNYDNTIPGCSQATGATYYVDTRGNTYQDAGLTKRANSYDCPTLVAKYFAPDDIISMSATGNVNLGPNGLLFAKNWENALGWYNMDFKDGTNDTSHSAAPLFIYGSNFSAPPQAFEMGNTTFTVKTDIGTKTLCLPARSFAVDEWFVYFFDKQGTPYRDLLLKQPATTKPCDQLLANSLTPLQITGGVINSNLYDQNAWIGRDQKKLAKISADGQIQQNTENIYDIVTGSRSPLIVDISNNDTTTNFSRETLNIGAGTIVMKTDLGVNTVCLPKTTVPFEQGVSYFYDANGTPYHDLFLQNPALDTNCSILLAKAFAPFTITSGTTDLDASDTDIWIGRDKVKIARISGDGQIYQNTENAYTLLTGSKTPLVVDLNNNGIGSNGPKTYGPGSITLQSDTGALSLCVPKTDLPYQQGASYFYDKFGNPYSDMLLQNRVACGSTDVTCSSIDCTKYPKHTCCLKPS